MQVGLRILKPGDDFVERVAHSCLRQENDPGATALAASRTGKPHFPNSAAERRTGSRVRGYDVHEIRGSLYYGLETRVRYNRLRRHWRLSTERRDMASWVTAATCSPVLAGDLLQQLVAAGAAPRGHVVVPCRGDVDLAGNRLEVEPACAGKICWKTGENRAQGLTHFFAAVAGRWCAPEPCNGLRASVDRPRAVAGAMARRVSDAGARSRTCNNLLSLKQ